MTEPSPNDPQQSMPTCICGHVEAHHRPVGPLNPLVMTNCEWRGCGCPRLVPAVTPVGKADREARDLRLRIERTLEYTDELLRGPLHRDAATIARAVHNSLCTPAERTWNDEQDLVDAGAKTGSQT